MGLGFASSFVSTVRPRVRGGKLLNPIDLLRPGFRFGDRRSHIVVSVRLSVFLASFVFGSSSIAQDSKPSFRLEGVIVAHRLEASIALVRASGARRARSLGIGESLGGWRLIDVVRDSAVFERDGVASRLEFSERTAEVPGVGELGVSIDPRPVLLPVADPVEPTELGADWLRRRFDRSTIQQRLMKEMPVLLSETGLTPRVENGEILGLRLTRIPDGTILSESGLLPGDVLLRVNDEPVKGLQSLMGLLSGLQRAEQVRVVVRRGTETVRVLYEFQ